MLNKNLKWQWLTGTAQVVFKGNEPDFIITTNRPLRYVFFLIISQSITWSTSCKIHYTVINLGHINSNTNTKIAQLLFLSMSPCVLIVMKKVKKF